MQRVHEILGVGAITASAVVATVGNATDFKNGRQVHAGPNHQTRRSIPENPSRARRTYSAHERHQSTRKNQPVVTQLIARRGFNKACIAMAAKNARIIWAVLARGQAYRPDHMVTMP